MIRNLIFTLLIVLATGSAFAAQYIKAEDFKNAIEQKKDMFIVDIQEADDFDEHHFAGSLETNAYPVKSTDEKKRLDKILPTINTSVLPVVIICPRGKGGAMNTYEHLKAQGVSEGRLFILEGGMAGWPYKEILQHGR
ncbi:MAG: rhodanese-like domain-containing protein [Geobacteraceae bacterium]|nr:rhodanese-like domain-containing protein [Geobacteraceae bacterium]